MRKFSWLLCLPVLLMLALGFSAPGQAAFQAPTPTPICAANAAEGFTLSCESGSSAGYRPSAAELQVSPDQTLSTTDQYGYSWSTPTFAWVDATSGMALVFSGADDDYTELSIGFPFKFYQETYTQAFVSTNGLLTFGAGTSASSNDFFPQPRTSANTPPNNVIAPLWDDWAVGGAFNSGKVYFRQGGSAPNRYLVVEWYQVTPPVGGVSPITFEALLYENGNILFQYWTDLDASGATVGIEDPDGMDGLMYSYNAPGLGAGTAVLFTRPPAGGRGRVWPTYQGDFTISRQAAFQFSILNTGDTVDSYELIPTLSDPAWSLSLYPWNSTTPLPDSDHDGKAEVGPLGVNAPFTVTAKLQSPASAEVGDTLQVSLQIQSLRPGGRATQTELQTALPASFAQVFDDNAIGVHLGLTHSSRRDTYFLDVWFSGSNMALSGTASGAYLLSWERNGTAFTNAEYTMLDFKGQVITPTTRLTDNATASRIYDLSPVMAGAPNGKIGVTFLHKIYDIAQNRTNWNVYFSVLDAQGRVRLAPKSVTLNDQWDTGGSIGVPTFESPRIVSLSDNRFLLMWVDGRFEAGGYTRNLAYAICDDQGSIVRAVENLTSSAPGGLRYAAPSVERLANGKVIVAYNQTDADEQNARIYYVVLDPSGDIVKAETPLVGSDGGFGVDVVELSGGNILFGWTHVSAAQIAYTILAGSDYSVIWPATELTNPNLRQADYVSVTRDREGHGILVWMDESWNQYLYYALVDSDGTMITSPMIFYSAISATSIVQTSRAGLGVAPLDWQQIFLPLVVRHAP